MQRVRYRLTESANWVSLELKSGLLFGQGEYDLTNEAVALLILVANILKVQPISDIG